LSSRFIKVSALIMNSYKLEGGLLTSENRNLLFV
jgi:hypothetical protein